MVRPMPVDRRDEPRVVISIAHCHSLFLQSAAQWEEAPPRQPRKVPVTQTADTSRRPPSGRSRAATDKPPHSNSEQRRDARVENASRAHSQASESASSLPTRRAADTRPSRHSATSNSGVQHSASGPPASSSSRAYGYGGDEEQPSRSHGGAAASSGHALQPCPLCGLNFRADRLASHQRVCETVSGVDKLLNSAGRRPSRDSRRANASPSEPPEPTSTRQPEPSAPLPAQAQAQKKPPDVDSLVVGGGRNSVMASLEDEGAGGAVQMERCPQCGRSFDVTRLDRHAEICFKTAHKTRKVFDSKKARIGGTDAQQFAARQTATGGKQKNPQKTAKWKKEHESFIANIRAARQYNKAVAAGVDPRNIPMPNLPSQDDDFVPCPHCGRTFNETAAVRHIPRCATTVNKPKPVGVGAAPRSRR